jgi:hypothetical protein
VATTPPSIVPLPPGAWCSRLGRWTEGWTLWRQLRRPCTRHRVSTRQRGCACSRTIRRPAGLRSLVARGRTGSGVMASLPRRLCDSASWPVLLGRSHASARLTPVLAFLAAGRLSAVQRHECAACRTLRCSASLPARIVADALAPVPLAPSLHACISEPLYASCSCGLCGAPMVVSRAPLCAAPRSTPRALSFGRLRRHGAGIPLARALCARIVVARPNRTTRALLNYSPSAGCNSRLSP